MRAGLTAEVRELGAGKAGAEATAKARLEEIERVRGLVSAGLLTRLREFWQGWRGKEHPDTDRPSYRSREQDHRRSVAAGLDVENRDLLKDRR
jgi:hypothetical protein